MGIKGDDGKIKIGKATVNKEDLMYDLTHNASKLASFNLTNQEHELALKQLKKRECLQVIFVIFIYVVNTLKWVLKVQTKVQKTT